MAIPRAVKKQAREAERLQQQLIDQGAPDASVNPPVPPPDPSNPQPPTAVDPVDWEKRWKGLKASHDETVTELRNENLSLKDELTDLRDLVEKATVQQPAAQATDLFSDEEREKYGDDFLAIVERVAKQVSPTTGSDEIAKELKELKDGFSDLAETQVKTQEQKFFEGLDELVPDWEQINADDRFKEWLAAEMPLTGFERQHFLNLARKQFDVKRAVAIFDSWKGGANVPLVPTPDTVTTTETDINLGEGAQDSHIFSGAEIGKFYDDVRRGKWKGREAEARQHEERIFKAQNQGRVRP